ncbi:MULTISPECIES: hypothetical protein [unclassified Microbacterium]|uniref:hypothetical protein n=1 Tax=unclassified Microbacterium TaxID=2609290 RepID=UPI001FCEB9F8|nr:MULTISPECIES: hypothetical protein [unclassified Microbacterium]
MGDTSDDIIALVRELVLLETPSRDSAASARIADLLAGWFGEVGAPCTRRPPPPGSIS